MRDRKLRPAQKPTSSSVIFTTIGSARPFSPMATPPESILSVAGSLSTASIHERVRIFRDEIPAIISTASNESEDCYKVFKGSWQQIEDTANQPGGLELLRKSFKICKNDFRAGDLEGWLRAAYVYTAMTDYPAPSNFLNPLPAYPVKQMCT